MNLKTDIDLSKYKRYAEVILGEGESFIELDPQIPCILNDSNTDLISFYKYIHEPELQQELKSFAKNWNLIGEFANFSSQEILIAFQDLNQGIISSEDVEYMIRAIVMMNMLHDNFIPLFEQKFVVSADLFNNALINPVVDALLKLKGDNLSEKYQSEEEGFRENIETAFRRGFFRHFRSLLNWQKTELIDCISLSKHLASWLFIKDFSKEPHLNYDKNGNIKNHYGGSLFNSKTFEAKVNSICQPDFIKRVQSATLNNYTPTQFIKEAGIDKNDLVIANLCESNLILSTGKNYASKHSQIDQVKDLLLHDLSLIIITDDRKLGIEFEALSKGKFTLSSEGNRNIISNINQ